MKKTLLLILVLGFCSFAQADDAQKVLECMRGNVPSALRVQDVELTSTDRAEATRTLRGKVYALREGVADQSRLRIMLRVKAPENLAGSAFLMREATNVSDQGMYVFLPSVRRVRRITGEFADGALLGSDFSYQDFRHLQNGFEDLSSTLEAPEQIDGRPVHVLSSLSQRKPSAYGRIRSWVDQKTCVPLKVEFYQNKTLLKQLTVPVAALNQSGAYWYPAEATIVDIRQGTRSTLRVLGVESGGKIKKGTFDPSLFYRINL
ncbi:MAG: outer membrane lipoprotein-sorting protein [Pseudomonadota bacterium]